MRMSLRLKTLREPVEMQVTKEVIQSTVKEEKKAKKK